MSTATLPAAPEQRFLLRNVRWQTYQALVAERDSQRYGITFDRGLSSSRRFRIGTSILASSLLDLS